MTQREIAVAGEIDLRTVGRRRLVDDVISHLRQLILDQELPPGTALLQTELAERLGVSRTPLREAFRILEREGLVKVANGNRTIEVARFGAAELRELYEMREVIDGLAARLLARNGLSEDLDGELKALLAEMDVTAEPFQPSRWFSAHLGFHVRIATCCGNSQLHSMLNLIRMTTLSLHGPLHDRAELGPSATWPRSSGSPRSSTTPFTSRSATATSGRPSPTPGAISGRRSTRT